MPLHRHILQVIRFINKDILHSMGNKSIRTYLLMGGHADVVNITITVLKFKYLWDNTWLVVYIFLPYSQNSVLLSSHMAIPIIHIQLELVSVNSLVLHLPTVFDTRETVARGDSWVILVDSDILTLVPVEKSIDKADQFTESKLMTHMQSRCNIMIQCDYPQHHA